MGALGLEGWRGQPHAKGCPLLAVAGATSLVTLLLAVPITVLAVLLVAPQEQGGLVMWTADPGAQAQKQLGTQQLPEEEAAEPDLGRTVPAAHLIGAWSTEQRVGWEADREEAFVRSGARFAAADGLALPRDGLYFLYCHVGYRGRAPPAGRPRRALTLRSRLYRVGGAYGAGAPELLLDGAESVVAAEPGQRHEYGPLWYTSVGFGGLVQLRRGERVYVNISHPGMVDYRRGKTFFGAVMVG
ncbi:lymphotoxin-beta [Sorex araneus]|uniref:lymphotoxin-beta n=1 Tax=Sorex araneus TaxID=42254 RepID=UPI002433FD8C|nr:lymphotoxin-beta [Sorex araneus]